MKQLRSTYLLLAALLLASCLNVAGAEKIKVMLLTGQCSKYHNWTLSSKVLKRILDEPGIFAVDTVTTPAAGADMSGFAPAFTNYQVVVMDYEGDEWPAATKNAFERYIKSGGGLVTFHDTDNAFPKWIEWNEMIGVGGWGNRTEADGPKVRWRDGKMVLDNSPGTAKHPARHDFLIEVRDPKHPITKGMPESWMHSNDELYSQLRGPAKNLHVLATASADPKEIKNGTGENEPMLMTIDYGKGRIFHLTLGHVGPQEVEPLKSLSCVGFQTVLQRGTEWAATGQATISIPAGFPTAEKTSLRK